jgi:uncharacterized protein involved in exopolysaccharide biosynthesis
MQRKGWSEMRFLAKLLKHWYLYLIPVLILPAGAAVYAERTLKVYESSALLYIQNSDPITGVNISGFSQYASPAQNGANAMNELLQSESFTVTVAEVTNLANQYDLTTRAGQDLAYMRLHNDITIAPSAVGGNTVSITVDDKDATIAQQIAAGLITVFADYFATQRLALDKKTEQFLLKEISAAKELVTQDTQRVNQYLAAHPNLTTQSQDPTLAQLEQQLQQDETNVQMLNGRLSSVQFDEAAATTGNSQLFTVLDQPQVPTNSTLHLKKLAVYPLGGLGAALALVVLIVGLRTVLDRKVYSTRDLRVIAEDLELEVTNLLTVPQLTTGGRNGSGDLLPGVLVPVLAVLPQQDSEALNQELRRAVGVSPDDM